MFGQVPIDLHEKIAFRSLVVSTKDGTEVPTGGCLQRRLIGGPAVCALKRGSFCVSMMDETEARSCTAMWQNLGSIQLKLFVTHRCKRIEDRPGAKKRADENIIYSKEFLKSS